MAAADRWQAAMRVVLQVKAERAGGDLSSTPMGGLVEPRRAFVRENALDVADLDVRRPPIVPSGGRALGEHPGCALNMRSVARP